MIDKLYIAGAVAAALVALYILGTFAAAFARESGTVWQRLLKAGEDSATIVWAKFSIAAGLLTAGLVQLAQTIGDPQVGAAIQRVMTPQTWGILFAAAMAITVLARKRTLGK